MSAQNITLLTQDSGVVIADVQDSAYLANSGLFGFEWVSKNNTGDKLVRSLVNGYLKSHTPGGSNKSPQDHLGGDITVEMHSYYDYVKFHDFHTYNQSEVVERVKSHMRGYYAATLNALLFGNLIWSSNLSDACTTTEVELDPATLADTITDVKNSNVVILDRSVEGAIRAANAEGANTNSLRDGAVTQLASRPVIWVDLYGPAGTTPGSGDPVGLVINGRDVVAIAQEPPTNLLEFSPETGDRASLEENTVSYAYQARIGYGIKSDASATILTLGDSESI